MCQAIRGSQHGEITIAGLAGLGENMVKRRCLYQAGAARESCAARLREQVVANRLNLWSKTLAPFGAASFDNAAATAGSHTGAEAVSTFAVNDAGLESALHHQFERETPSFRAGRDSVQPSGCHSRYCLSVLCYPIVRI